MIRHYTVSELKVQFKKLGLPWPEDQVHLIGIRGVIQSDDKFNDLFICVQQKPNQFAELTYATCTTIPGRYYLLNLMNPKGAAILKEGQYKSSWQIGLHHGYEAFTQYAPVTVYRDNNKNLTPEELKGSEDRGMFGIDLHRAGKGFIAQLIANFSAGCVVCQDSNVFEDILGKAKKSNQKFYTFSLINEW